MKSDRQLLALSGILLATAIGMGAFGAHALEEVLTPERLETWKTAVRYQAWNTLGLIGIALVSKLYTIKLLWPGRFVLAGIIIFSGSLYILCLSGIRWFGAITPIGGVALITGWIWFAVALYKFKTPHL